MPLLVIGRFGFVDVAEDGGSDDDEGETWNEEFEVIFLVSSVHGYVPRWLELERP